MKMIKLFSQYVSTCSLESVNHLIRCVTGVCLHEKMKVVRPDRQRINLPLVLLCYIEKNLFQTVCYFSLEDTRPSFRAPHEVVLHRVDGVTGFYGMVLC